MKKILLVQLLLLAALPVSAMPVIVPATGDPYLAGMPDGSTASAGGGVTDTAPQHSPTLVQGLSFKPGDILTFEVSGATEVQPANCPAECPSPDGSITFAASSFNGIAAVTSRLNALMGVFLDDNLPSSTPAPASLDFSAIGYDFSSFFPELKQVFFIGDGLTETGSGSTQAIVVPEGATRLYLATHDGFGWWNNSGEFSVEINVIEQASIPMLPVGFVVMMGLITFFVGFKMLQRAH